MRFQKVINGTDTHVYGSKVVLPWVEEPITAYPCRSF